MPLGRYVCYISHHKASQLDKSHGGSGPDHQHISPYLKQWEWLPVRLVTDTSALQSEESRRRWLPVALHRVKLVERPRCLLAEGKYCRADQLDKHKVVRRNGSSAN